MQSSSQQSGAAFASSVSEVFPPPPDPSGLLMETTKASALAAVKSEPAEFQTPVAYGGFLQPSGYPQQMLLQGYVTTSLEVSQIRHESSLHAGAEL